MRSAAAVDNGVVYTAEEDLLAVDAVTGKPLWTAVLPSSVSSPPVAFKNDILVGGDDGALYVVDRNGSLLWGAPTTCGMNMMGAPAVDGSLAYVGSCDGSLYAFDLATGARVWSTHFGSCVWSSPAYANGVVYVGTANTAVDAVDAKTGNVLLSSAVPVLYSSPAVADGTVYIGADDGSVYTFRR